MPSQSNLICGISVDSSSTLYKTIYNSENSSNFPHYELPYETRYIDIHRELCEANQIEFFLLITKVDRANYEIRAKLDELHTKMSFMQL